MIEMNDVTKFYDPNNKALNDFSLDVQPGEIVGLAGPNGAGKTTTLRLLATLLKPSSGRLKICGLDPIFSLEEIRRKVGYLAEQGGFYKKFSGLWNLNFYLQFYGSEITSSSIQQFAKKLQLSKVLSKPVGKYSYGMVKKLALIRILSYSPNVLLLDEPMNGLDVEAQLMFKNLLHESKTQDKTVLVSTHLLGDILDICDRIVILKHGKKLIDQNLAQVKEAYAKRNQNFDITGFYLNIIKGNTNL